MQLERSLSDLAILSQLKTAALSCVTKGFEPLRGQDDESIAMNRGVLFLMRNFLDPCR